MCGRFARFSPPEIFATLLQVQGTLMVEPSYNIAPTQAILAARAVETGDREFVHLHWGLIPHWSKGPDPKYSMINARADSVANKPAYRDPFKRHRCLIPADGFYEWQNLGNGKQPYFIRLRGGQPFAFAGLWDCWTGEGTLPIESATIITCDANALVEPIHERMPVILPPRLYDRWLDPTARPAQLIELLKPYPDLLMEAYPVGREVNSPRSDSSALIAPLLTD